MGERLIFHVDVNSAFLSWEAARRVKNGRRERDVKLDKAVDALRSKFGTNIIQRGTVMKEGLQVARKFKGKQASERNKE